MKRFIIAILLLYSMIEAREYISAVLQATPKNFKGKCPSLIKFKGKISVKRQGKIKYRFIRSDGASSQWKTLIFLQPGTKYVNESWRLGGSSLPKYKGWMAIEIIKPKKIVSNKANFKILCTNSDERLPDLSIEDIYLNKDCVVIVKLKNRGEWLVPNSVWNRNYPKNAGITIYINGKIEKSEFIKDFDPMKKLQKIGGEVLYNSKIKVSKKARITAKIDIWNVIKESNEKNNKKNITRKCNKKIYNTFIDKDKDGIDDRLELNLLKQFRPYYKFTKGENYPPTDAVYQIRYAQLLKKSWIESLPKPNIEKKCGRGEDNHIKPPSRLLYCLNKKLNLIRNPTKTHYYLNLNDDKRKDPGNGKKSDWKYAIKYAPGLYGHVVKEKENIKIEYWQYFSYNGQDLHGADHEGDWASVQLWYNPNKKKIIKTCHWVHGKGFCFNINRVKKIKKIKKDNKSFFHKFIGENYGKNLSEFKIFGKSSRYPKNYQNYSIEFYIEKNRPKDLHIVIYIEKDGHEFWPFSAGSFEGANKHTGNGLSYLTSFDTRNINLGELTNPFPNSKLDKFKKSKEIILRFNGYWGGWHHIGNNPPVGPTLHCQWTFPKSESYIAKKIVKNCEY